MFTLRRFIQPPEPIPAEFRRNFLHLYLDIAWWGLLNGTTLVFLSIYASRLGASTFQIGLLTASPALVNLVCTFPSGRLLGRWSATSATRWSALIARAFYALLVPLPILLPGQAQIWVIIAITFLMNIPGTLTAISFNAFFAETVPPEYRAQIAGTRNALFALTTMLTSLAAGFILARAPFPAGYQIVFAIGFTGAAMSLVHLFLVRPGRDGTVPAATYSARVNREVITADRAGRRAAILAALRLDVVRGAFGKILLLMFLLQFSIFVIAPVVPVYQVNVLKQSDQLISTGNAVFYVVYFLGSLQTRRAAARLGFQRETGLGLAVIAGALILFALAYQPWIYMIHLVFAGVGWALIGGGQVNFILERVPPDDRASYLAWYNLANNSALLLCGLLAPTVAGLIGLFGTLILAVGLRALVAFGFLRRI
jgi:MFS family permease